MGQPVTHFQIVTANPDGAAEFYSSLFGWTVDADNALGYRMFDTGSEEGITGGVWPAPPGAPAFVQLFIRVEDLDTEVKRAESLGATTIIPPQELPDGDAMAVMRDPDGATFALTRASK